MSWGSIENITKGTSLSAPTFVNHDKLPNINFNGHFLIINITCITKTYV